MIKKREKLRKHRRKKKYRENEEKITNTDLLVVTVVYFSLLIKKKSARKKKLYSTFNGKVSQSPKKKFFQMNEQKFLSYKFKYFKSSTIDITLLQ